MTAPSITSVTPSTLPTTGGAIVIYGTFKATTTVTVLVGGIPCVSGTPADLANAAATQSTTVSVACTLPPHAAATNQVVVVKQTTSSASVSVVVAYGGLFNACDIMFFHCELTFYPTAADDSCTWSSTNLNARVTTGTGTAGVAYLGKGLDISLLLTCTGVLTPSLGSSSTLTPATLVLACSGNTCTVIGKPTAVIATLTSISSTNLVITDTTGTPAQIVPTPVLSIIVTDCTVSGPSAGPCGAGQYCYLSLYCDKCPAGSYNPTTGGTTGATAVCQPCTIGHTTNAYTGSPTTGATKATCNDDAGATLTYCGAGALL